MNKIILVCLTVISVCGLMGHTFYSSPTTAKGFILKTNQILFDASWAKRDSASLREFLDNSPNGYIFIHAHDIETDQRAYDFSQIPELNKRTEVYFDAALGFSG